MMVLEQIFRLKILQKNPFYAVFLGLIYSLVAAATSYFFFKDQISLSMLFLITLLCLPSLMNLISIQEERDGQSGLRNFLDNHHDVFEIYFFLSIGIITGYLLVFLLFSAAGLDSGSTMSSQMSILSPLLDKNLIQAFEVNRLSHALNIFLANIGVAVLLFILSLFYGAGAIFLLVWNASVFSVFLFTTLKNLSSGVNNSLAIMGSFAIYVIPEFSGFLLAAIAGGIVSKAVINEELFSNDFQNVLRDAIALLLLSFILLFIAGFLESYVAVSLVKSLVS